MSSFEYPSAFTKTVALLFYLQEHALESVEKTIRKAQRKALWPCKDKSLLPGEQQTAQLSVLLCFLELLSFTACILFFDQRNRTRFCCTSQETSFLYSLAHRAFSPRTSLSGSLGGLPPLSCLSISLSRDFSLLVFSLEAFLQPSMHFGGRLGVLSTVLGRPRASFLCSSFLRDCLSRKFVLSPGRRNGHVFPWVWKNDSRTSREEERKRACLFPSRGCRSKCVSKRSSRRTLGLGLSFPFHLLSSTELHPKMHLNIYNKSMHVCMWKSLRLETQATLVPFVRNGQGEAPMWRWKNARKVLRTPQLLK
uniref:Putative transmembrane protein n=1 Tax=Toxoplasma gondii COUG TaxID=1074873 RepID=A0A2G8Y480_TOXGO|nr:putative transmembrane protein [Toxoplasma gondii COUG]